MRMPLHIFEPRYQQMLQDCLDNNSTFGLIYRDEDIAEEEIPPGTVGCRAKIDEVSAPTDGRVNIIVNGRERFALARIVAFPAPYIVAEVEPFDDVEEPVAQVTALALRLGELFTEAAVAAQALADDAGPVPLLSSHPGEIAFAAAASIEMETADRQRLLASRSPSARMRDLIALLGESLPTLKERAAVHQRAKMNGHAPRPAS
jgi:Lon protease-like protein